MHKNEHKFLNIYLNIVLCKLLSNNKSILQNIYWINLFIQIKIKPGQILAYYSN